MMNLVTEIQHWDIKDFIVGFMKYLKDPNRKNELFTAIVSPPAPPTTKSEQVLLYIISELRYHWENVDLVCDILNNMEYHLFCLNRTPDFNTIESMAHFYAVLCRYYRMSSRLRLFVLDALYCIQFKAVPLIKQCLDVWMHILPLAHMGIGMYFICFEDILFSFYLRSVFKLCAARLWVKMREKKTDIYFKISLVTYQYINFVFSEYTFSHLSRVLITLLQM